MFTFNISLAVLLSAALLLSEKKLQVEANACYSNTNCGYNYYCCKQRYWQSSVCRYGGCVGQACYSNSDCGRPDECCNLTKYCTKSPCDECSSNSDCGYNKYCCKQRYSSQTNVCGYGGCVGQSCSSKNDCGGPDECCNTTNYCTTSGCTECSSNSNCSYNEHCCKQWNPNQSPVCGDGCVGHPCGSYSDCGSNEYCADFAVCQRLKTTVATYECTSDSDCGRPPGPDECCRSNHCTTSGCWITLTSVAIISVVGSVIFTIVVTLGVVAWCNRRKRRRGTNNSASHTPSQQRVGVRQETDPAAVIAPQNAQTVQTSPIQFERPPPYAPSAPPVHYNQGQDFPLQQLQFPQYAPDYNFQR